MRLNEFTAIVGQKVVLVPYRSEHVEQYHKWMQDPELLELTASEPLSFEEEMDMQRKWRDDSDKLTFIILARTNPNQAATDPDSIRELPMIGDVNLFLKGAETDDGDRKEAEVEIMIAERGYRRKGLAFEALQMFLSYTTTRDQDVPGLALDPYQLVVRIGGSNTPSRELFKRLGFVVSKEVEVFDEVEMRWHWDESGVQPELSRETIQSLPTEKMVRVGFVLLGILQVALAANKWIVPGAVWRDTDGKVLHAHAGGVTQHEDTWYWFGQNEEEGKPLFSGITVYSSKDLVNWKNEGIALAPVNGTEIGPQQVVERPKVVYNEPTKTWVMWFHADNSSYGLLGQGVATSPNITGPYTFQYTLRPLGDFSQDIGLFQDDDGKVYTLYSNGDSDPAHDNKITLLNENYTQPLKEVYTFYDFDLEAPNILRTPNLYYIIMSHKTGYRPNNVVYFSAQNISGPWSIQNYITPMGTRSFNSQSTFNIRVKGSKRTSWIYAGDQWATSRDLYESTYIWLPVEVDDRTGSLKITWHDIYSIDVKTGNFIYPTGKTYEAESGVVTGSAYATRCPTCSGNKIVTGISGSNSTLTINGIKGNGRPQWVSFYYHNPDGLFGDNRGVSGQSFTLARFASVSVNGATPVRMRQRDTNAGVIMTQTLNVTFTKGSNNSITIGGYNGGAAADLDRIIVYDSD
ncbi:unnamed protein product [Rhizoctonia solani]|uniref:N-acetyltransferase domain-containing protein n=1 Tax=Rhizoctonia solani TaxID=456999 RepID=A0A8H2XDC0_9AGAM|nr:unnamed protein product [Rhizoctonia solani]